MTCRVLLHWLRTQGLQNVPCLVTLYSFWVPKQKKLGLSAGRLTTSEVLQKYNYVKESQELRKCKRKSMRMCIYTYSIGAIQFLIFQNCGYYTLSQRNQMKKCQKQKLLPSLIIMKGDNTYRSQLDLNSSNNVASRSLPWTVDNIHVESHVYRCTR